MEQTASREVLSLDQNGILGQAEAKATHPTLLHPSSYKQQGCTNPLFKGVETTTVSTTCSLLVAL